MPPTARDARDDVVVAARRDESCDEPVHVVWPHVGRERERGHALGEPQGRPVHALEADLADAHVSGRGGRGRNGQALGAVRDAALVEERPDLRERLGRDPSAFGNPRRHVRDAGRRDGRHVGLDEHVGERAVRFGAAAARRAGRLLEEDEQVDVVATRREPQVARLGVDVGRDVDRDHDVAAERACLGRREHVIRAAVEVDAAVVRDRAEGAWHREARPDRER